MSAAVAIAPRYLTAEQAARYCGVGRDYFTSNYSGPVVQVGASVRMIRYDVIDLDQWMKAKKVGETGAANDSGAIWLDKLGFK
jgi:hypothetical protein